MRRGADVGAALQQQMDHLGDMSLVGGERTDATDHCLAGIARLSNEVKDAASYIPTYDQRIYAEVGVSVVPTYVLTIVGYQGAPRQAHRNTCCCRTSPEVQFQDEEERLRDFAIRCSRIGCRGSSRNSRLPISWHVIC